MKTLFTGIIVLAALSGNSQSKFEKAIATTVCECIDKFKNMDEERFTECFGESMSKNEDLLMEEFKKLGLEETEEAGYKFGQEVFKKMSVSLVYSCKNYAKFMDDVRMTAFRDIDKDSIKTLLQSQAKAETSPKDQAFLTQRGINYFLVGEFGSALNDFNAVLREDDKAYQAKFMKAWALEKQQQYDEAIKIYTELAGIMKKDEFKIFAAICEQKKKGIL